LFEDPPRRIPLFPFSAPIFLSSNFNPAIARRIFSGEGEQGARQRNGLFITAQDFAVMPPARRKKIHRWFKKNLRWGEENGNNGTRAASIKKKPYENTNIK
jgi:hypothetical protein